MMSDRSRASSEELAAAVMAGDRAAWTELYLLWTPRIYGWFMTKLSDDPAAVDDLTQDTMIGAWQAIELWQKPPRRFGPWIHTIAHNKLSGYFTAKAANKNVVQRVRQERFDPGDFTIGALREVEMREDWPWFIDLLRDAIDSMPVRYRTVLRTHLATGATGADLAQLLGLSVRDATRWRSQGRPLLYNTVAVTMMARGTSTAGRPCRAFRRILTEAGWTAGPLGEALRDRLIHHVNQCRRCQDQRDELKKTLQLLPVFITIIVPASVYAGIRENTDRKDKRRSVATPVPVALALEGQPEKPSGVDRVLNGIDWLIDNIGKPIAVLVVATGVLSSTQWKHLIPSHQTVRLQIWVPGGYVAPAGRTCTPLARENCDISVRPGTQVTLTAQKGEMVPYDKPLSWFGCPTGTNAAYPCTFVPTGRATICLIESGDEAVPWQWCRGRR
ncbi:RNA polymerase sigma factor [Nocardia terpenica]|uniref:RNA polymerase sigma factor n=1 Tax=Nocardia terpenica TaxID=455432 RepID=A0A291RPH3_9NOCA|nr:RNA polymerase sigma factor [Nocardia terpenica]ATL69169.1 hypothetical protein CRH09_26310 [Nocardia terpenica]